MQSPCARRYAAATHRCTTAVSPRPAPSALTAAPTPQLGQGQRSSGSTLRSSLYRDDSSSLVLSLRLARRFAYWSARARTVAGIANTAVPETVAAHTASAFAGITVPVEAFPELAKVTGCTATGSIVVVVSAAPALAAVAASATAPSAAVLVLAAPVVAAEIVVFAALPDVSVFETALAVAQLRIGPDALAKIAGF